MRQDSVLSLLSLATKANRIVSGEFMAEKEVRAGNVFLFLVASDASENTKKKFKNMCEYYEVPLYIYQDKVSLGKAIGKEYRASIAILDEGFAKSMRKHLDKCIEEVVE